MLDRLGIVHPIIQAPMAGSSTSAMAAAVCEAGGLGSLALGALDADGAAKAIADLRGRTVRPFNVNLFCHRPAVPDPAREKAWLDRFAPEFARNDADPPAALREIYRSFTIDHDMLSLLLDVRPAIASFHFGLPPADAIAAMKAAGILLLATATSLDEARRAEDAGIDAIVAQGWEAGGHRGMFDENAHDDMLSTFALVRLLATRGRLPVIAAGGIMDGAGISAMLRIGAVAAQLGTAFLLTDECAADAGHRAALTSDAARHTVMTRAISGRPARCLANRFTALDADRVAAAVPDYPIAYDAGKALNAAAKAAGETGYGAQWAGQGAPLARAMPAGELVETLVREMRG